MEAQMTGSMIEVEGVGKRFGATVALAGVDLSAEQGKVLGLLGPNGAGKTTLVRILTTLLKPDAGTARVAGYNVVADAGPLRSCIGLAGQYAAVDELLTGRENLELVGLWYHLRRVEYRRRAEELLERFALTDAADRLVKGYSGGMRRRLDVQPAWWPTQRCCSWTSPRRVWTLEPATTYGSSLKSWSLPARPSCSRRSTWRRQNASPTKSS
jgi:ABC-2 type transport system ATP-binding protein